MVHPPRVLRSSVLPDFPWDSLADVRAKAESHPDGFINLSVGTPVDPVSPAAQLGLAQNSGSPGYPQTVGTQELRESIVGAMSRRYGIIPLDPDRQVLPVIGTKEAIAWLPSLLGVGTGHTVVIPELAYPTYEVGAVLAGASVVRADSIAQAEPHTPTLMYINSPANPTGAVLGVDDLRTVVEWARDRDVIVVSDECYLGLGWDTNVNANSSGTPTAPVSLLHPDVCDGDTTNVIVVHSLSKTSNMASYRSGWLAGDQSLIGELLAVRKHAGFMVPLPVQAATVAALNDDGFEQLQREIYRYRREVLASALHSAGFTIDGSEAGLYLWITRGEPCRATVDWFAERGILVAPGEFYGPKGGNHVRVGLTGTDEQIVAAAERMTR
ncbi:succinyldiaminopimelate transaminase [Corynebacterium kroppenstedtii]|uniref:succinyldiaminopimelate transaminase n=1 Tax=Corynebacterium sp. PCR 32 TaxID=3351342 RepID=UPI00309B01D0